MSRPFNPLVHRMLLLFALGAIALNTYNALEHAAMGHPYGWLAGLAGFNVISFLLEWYGARGRLHSYMGRKLGRVGEQVVLATAHNPRQSDTVSDAQPLAPVVRVARHAALIYLSNRRS